MSWLRASDVVHALVISAVLTVAYAYGREISALQAQTNATEERLLRLESGAAPMDAEARAMFSQVSHSLDQLAEAIKELRAGQRDLFERVISVKR